VALALPVLLVCVLASTGGWQIRHGRVERVATPPTVSAAPAATTTPQAPPVDQVSFARHLSPSVPWPAWAGLVLLCLLPATASMLAWQGTRRARDAGSSGGQGAA